MPLIADSTNHVAYTPESYPLDALTVAVTDEDGAAVTFAGVVTPDAVNERYTLTLDSDEITGALLGQMLTVTWTATGGGQVRTDIERIRVVESERIVDVAEAIAFLEASGNPGYTGAEVEPLLLQAEAAIRDHTGCRFSPYPVTEARKVPVFGDRYLVTDELITATSVTDRNGSAISFDEVPSGGDHLLYLDLNGVYDGFVTVTGQWGYTTIPEPVKRAVLATVRIWAQNDLGVATLRDDIGTTYPRILSLPRDVLPLLAPYRRVRF